MISTLVVCLKPINELLLHATGKGEAIQACNMGSERDQINKHSFHNVELNHSNIWIQTVITEHDKLQKFENLVLEEENSAKRTTNQFENS